MGFDFYSIYTEPRKQCIQFKTKFSLQDPEGLSFGQQTLPEYKSTKCIAMYYLDKYIYQD